MESSFKRACYGIIIVCVFLSSPFRTSGQTGENIVVFTDHYQQGEKLEISISQCSDLPDNMARQLTSINTNSKCARFYDGKKCTGESIEILPRSPSHHNLASWNFNDRAVSVGPCRDACDPEVTGGYPDQPPTVEIFTRPNYKGAVRSLQLKGCVLIPTSFVFRTLSVKTNGYCVQLYNNVNCDSTGENIDTIELRPNTPSHDDVSRWYFPKAKAMSHCSYKCNKTSKPITNVTLPHRGELLLYDDTNFEGNWFMIRLESKLCVDLPQDWEGVATSIKVGNQTCVILFDRSDCQGTSHLVTSSQEDLSQRKFEELARSLKSCGAWIHTTEESHIDAIPSTTPEWGDLRPTTEIGLEQQNNPDYASLSPGVLAAVIIVPILGVIISVILVVFIMKRYHPYSDIIEKLTEKEILEFLNGLGMDIERNGETKENDNYSIELLAQNKAYNQEYEIPRSRIKYDSNSPLGVGEFGIVYKGTVLSVRENQQHVDEAETVSVAIKTVKPSSGAQYLRSLLKEVKVMLYIGKHPYITRMVGCCTENLRKGEILVLMEYCSNGSLEGFLQKNRHNFINMVKKGKIDNNQEKEIAEMNGYLRLEDICPGTQFNIFQLLKWCMEVARGMEFLAMSKVIHSDLAARNVLIADNFQAKISDFGLSRQLYCYSQYVKKHQEPLPWRWLAIESLKNLEFSEKSDVWSYGILCWEIFTLGEKPYPGVVWSNNFIANLEEGLRLVKPKFATTECYNLMILCWEEDPMLRPTFTEIIEELKEINVANNYVNTANPSTHSNIITN